MRRRPGVRRMWQDVTTIEAIEALRELVLEDRAKIVRLWSKRLRAETHEIEVAGRDLRAPLDDLIGELGRLLDLRGEEALRLWPEAIRSHGARRYEQRFDTDDLIREFKVLQHVLLDLASRRHGQLDLAFAQVVAELVGEATASVEASFARVMRTEEVRFRDAAVMESVLHHIDVGIMVVELDGTVSYVTPPVKRLLGVPVRVLAGAPSHQVLGAILTQIRAQHPGGEAFKITDMPFFRALREKRTVRRSTMVVQRHDGDERFLELNAIPLYEGGEEGEMIGVIQTVVDRTGTARKTRELSEAYEELRRLQGRLLQRTRTQALGELASGAAHALNNFLNVIRLRLTLLRREFKPEHLDSLDRTVRNIGDMVSRLQEFSSSRGEDDLRDVAVDEVVTEAVQLARPDFGGVEPAVTLRVTPGAGGKARVDAGYFRELVVNLLLASRDRMAGTGGTVEVSTRLTEGWVYLTIRDSAPVYTEDDLMRMFDPLKSKSRPQQSLLLGVARHQIQRWGGELQAQNREGGTEYVLKLPEVQVTEEEAPPPEPRRPPARRFQETRRVLVVDDEPENARMLAQVLSDEGYLVQMAQNGQEAMSLWDGSRFDAALLDVMMPDISGFELARQIRAHSPQALLAVVTGADVRGQNRQNLALVDAVFRKPIDVAALDDFLSQSGAEPEEPPRLEPDEPR